MPAVTPEAVRKQIAQRTPDPVYLLVGDDDAESSRLATELAGLVEEELRAFNLERLYASDKGTTPSAIVEAARTLPMLGDRRVVLVLRAERLWKAKRGSKAEDSDDAEAGEPGDSASDLDALTQYVNKPEPLTTLVIVATDIKRNTRLYKALQKNATIVECWGLRAGRDGKVDLWQAARLAEKIVRDRVAESGQQIEPAASKLLAERAGADIATLRADVERLLLYAAGKPKIDVTDVREIVSEATSQDDWAVTNAIARQDTAEALRQLALALDAGGVPYQILGQLAWFVRDRLPPARVPAAIEALFRADLDLKSSGGDPRVLLERLVVELSRR